MLELTENQQLRPDLARQELLRARRIRDNFLDPAGERRLQDYIDELEAFLDRARTA